MKDRKFVYLKALSTYLIIIFYILFRYLLYYYFTLHKIYLFIQFHKILNPHTFFYVEQIKAEDDNVCIKGKIR